ncbi:hypothetical protein [Methylomonas koyamae]|uniref:hypothetical protein n=1 Tax=Methylomonas koyamae TaxID=702114 RepID=UPI0006D03BBB|nr:hypothetical protein [Methylomonas koyamae]BBL59934.1 hypothetical protein MKFW12EY_35470 [Methylomonas koyamae]
MRLKILKYLLVACVALLAFVHGQLIEMSRQTPLFEGLRNTSSIIFGVMGAWLAILHPDSLKKVFGNDGVKIPEKEKGTIMLLLSPIIISTSIIAVVLVLFPLIELAKTIDAFHQYKEILRGGSFSLLSVLTFFQLWALILTLVPGDIVKKHIDKENGRHAVVKRMFSGTTKRKNSND